MAYGVVSLRSFQPLATLAPSIVFEARFSPARSSRTHAVSSCTFSFVFMATRMAVSSSPVTVAAYDAGMNMAADIYRR